MLTCDDYLGGHIYERLDELKMRVIGYWSTLEEDAVHKGKEADMSVHGLNIIGTKSFVICLVDTGAVLSVM